MWRYVNANTGHVVELPGRDACLDMLPNWSATPLGAAPGEEPQFPPVAAPEAAATAGVRPPESAKKEVWIAYAVSQGMAERDARALSKAALVEEFGEDSGNDDD